MLSCDADMPSQDVWCGLDGLLDMTGKGLPHPSLYALLAGSFFSYNVFNAFVLVEYICCSDLTWIAIFLQDLATNTKKPLIQFLQ